jgi:hypothetical protein
VKVFPDHAPKPKQPNHYGILRKHCFGSFLPSKNLTDVMPSAFISIDDAENGRVAGQGEEKGTRAP